MDKQPFAAAAVIVLSLSPTGPVPGAGGVGECVANIEPLDVSNRDEVGVGEIANFHAYRLR
jgi:hypothetical protein